ncbi:flagellar basal body-associated protein FliL [Bacillus benzoevorans]|uniref:Flagellar protein FliL n=1 Tax=Bacillus benzoevorans TaxID=1456 RepID=A0A7X0HNH4_9BACI|nr:flagellar basal body-associated protein FliL [Bacillus benzoevorans]MBB6443851.1 flagellar FliL protein [Bacillus benzoevorans]
MKNKLVMLMMILLVAIALAGAVALVYVLKYTNQEPGSEPSIEQVLDVSVDIPEITTNLASDGFVRISFKIQTDSKKAKKELEQRMFQVNNIIILELSDKTAENIKGREGQKQFEEELKTQINEIMQEGKVEKVYITQFILQ